MLNEKNIFYYYIFVNSSALIGLSSATYMQENNAVHLSKIENVFFFPFEIEYAYLKKIIKY